MEPGNCPFCNIDDTRVFHRGTLVIGIWDKFAVSDGHALLVPTRHVPTWFDATESERNELLKSIDIARETITQKYSPDGFNIGINVGQAAGQTVFHLHVHVIPRYKDDVSDPTGGVRNVIPGKANYLKDTKSSFDDFPHKRALVTGGDDPLLPHILAEIDLADQVDMAVAFVQRSGVQKIIEHVRDLLHRDGKLRFLTGDYMDITDPDAIAPILDLVGEKELRVYEGQRTSFHPKAYLFRCPDGVRTAYIGSSNLSQSALEQGIEWNYRSTSSEGADDFRDIADAFDELFNHPATRPVDEQWLESYRDRRRPPSTTLGVGIPLEDPLEPPEPNSVQKAALAALTETRARGNEAGLVVLATGLGKTWLSAFDSTSDDFHRVLFVAHREEILNQAIRTFRRIRPKARLGRYTGEEKTPNADILFASIQTLGRTKHLNRFDPAAFDYIVVDEFHHAAAATYRRLLAHFSPKFLLGLTATPERTDGGELLALCQENLVFRQDLMEGIRAELLCPFHYFGVPDEVDYKNIPWRSSRFDEKALTEAVATNKRAENALEQYRKRAGSRTLAFCCSQRHADFMADYFENSGVSARAVHSGPNSAPRAASLEHLESGDLKVVFAVDMFNEGVDLPSVDTVMMLRPTESSIVWLQQFGRGLRTSEGKDHLTVIDYIGNHRSFLLKPRTLFQLPPGDGQIDRALRALEAGSAELPPGCEVTYELGAVDIIKALLRIPKSDEALRVYYESFRELQGTRPKAVEAFHDGYGPRSARRTYGSWIRFVDSMGDLGAEQTELLEHVGEFLDQLEVTQMTKSFKMLTLSAMLNRDALPGDIAVSDLAEEFAHLARRSEILRGDVGVALNDRDELRKLLKENPIAAWAGGKGTGGVSYFSCDGERFASSLDVSEKLRPGFQEIVREVVEWRLAEYLSRDGRTADTSRLVCRVSHAGNRPIIFLPDREKTPNIPQGWTNISVDGVTHRANFVEVAVNVVNEEGSSENRLPEILKGWFGPDAGKPGTQFDVAFDRTPHGLVMAPVGKGGSDASEALWRSFPRDKIPGLFGFEFKRSIWETGFVTRPGHAFLLVTLDKGGLAKQHKYEDRFIDANTFQWQSQNRTTQRGKHGQELKHHAEKGIDVHLFVRRDKLRDKKAAPFLYCGEVDFVDWKGEAPITIVWRLQARIPRNLRVLLGLPNGGDESESQAN